VDGPGARQTMQYPVARLLLTSTLCAAPLALGSVEPWAWPWLALLALATLVAWGATCLRQGKVQIYWSPLYWVGAMFLAFGFVQFFAGLTQDRFATRNALILLTTDFILLFLAGQLFAGEASASYRSFGRVVLFYISGLGLFAIFQAMTSRGLIYWRIKPAFGAVFGPYVNRNDYAGLMEMLIPVAAAYVFTRRAGDSKQPLYVFGVVIAVASLLLSGSRGGMVALLAETVILLIVAFRLKLLARWRYSALGAALALAAGIGLSIWMNPAYLTKRIESLASFPTEPGVTLGQRLVASRDTLEIFRDHPWLGTGLGTFVVVFPRYQSFATNAVWEHAHDDYAEALAETGWVGGLFLLVGIVVFLRTAFGRLKERLDSSAGWIRLGAALGCCGLLVHSVVDFNLHIPANAAWFAVCLGLATTSYGPGCRSWSSINEAEKE